MSGLFTFALLPLLFGHGGGGGGEAEVSRHAFSVWAEEHAEYRCEAYRNGMDWDESIQYAEQSSRQAWRALFVSYEEKMRAFNDAIKRDCKALHVEAWNAEASE